MNTTPARLAAADERILQLLDGWRAARNGRLVAQRADFDPLTISRLLEHVWIYRFAPERNDYVCELAGEEVNAVWGNSIKGLTLTEIVGETNRATLSQRWEIARGEPAILYSAMEELPDPHFVHRVERLVLPMQGRTGEIDAVLGVSLYNLRRHRLSSGADTEATMPAEVVQIPVADL